MSIDELCGRRGFGLDSDNKDVLDISGLSSE